MIKVSIDNGKYGCGIFIDLRKEFDTVNHKILLNKLEHYGVRDVMLDLFESYLNKHKQYVSVNGQSFFYNLFKVGTKNPVQLGNYNVCFNNKKKRDKNGNSIFGMGIQLNLQKANLIINN